MFYDFQLYDVVFVHPTCVTNMLKKIIKIRWRSIIFWQKNSTLPTIVMGDTLAELAPMRSRYKIVICTPPALKAMKINPILTFSVMKFLLNNEKWKLHKSVLEASSGADFGKNHEGNLVFERLLKVRWSVANRLLYLI